MKFGIAELISQKFMHRSSIINSLSDILEEKIKGENFSSVIDGLYIGFVCVEDKSMSFYKEKKPKLSRKNRFFEYRLFFELDQMLKLSDAELMKCVLTQIIESTDIIKSKVKDFNEDGYIKLLKEISDNI